jgi:hypothetical protein
MQGVSGFLKWEWLCVMCRLCFEVGRGTKSSCEVGATARIFLLASGTVLYKLPELDMIACCILFHVPDFSGGFW